MHIPHSTPLVPKPSLHNSAGCRYPARCTSTEYIKFYSSVRQSNAMYGSQIIRVHTFWGSSHLLIVYNPSKGYILAPVLLYCAPVLSCLVLPCPVFSCLCHVLSSLVLLCTTAGERVVVRTARNIVLAILSRPSVPDMVYVWFPCCVGAALRSANTAIMLKGRRKLVQRAPTICSCPVSPPCPSAYTTHRHIYQFST